MNQKTTLPKVKDIEHKWYVIDATDEILGRLATKAADLLRGKNSVDYTPFYDQGNHVCIINASKIKVTGNKLADKMYYKYTGYVGNMKKENLASKLSRKPEEVILLAVKRMLPKNKLANSQLNRLRIFATEEYPHKVQKPIKVKLNK